MSQPEPFTYFVFCVHKSVLIGSSFCWSLQVQMSLYWFGYLQMFELSLSQQRIYFSHKTKVGFNTRFKVLIHRFHRPNDKLKASAD